MNKRFEDMTREEKELLIETSEEGTPEYKIIEEYLNSIAIEHEEELKKEYVTKIARKKLKHNIKLTLDEVLLLIGGIE